MQGKREVKMSEDPHNGLTNSLLNEEEGSRKEDLIVDWLGRPTLKTQLGGWKSALLITAASIFSGIGTSGITSNLVVYLVAVWKQSNATAATSYTNLTGFTFLTTLLGAFLSEAYFGRLWTTVLFQVITLLGCTLVSWIATVREYRSNPTHVLEIFLFISLYLMSLGQGSYQVTLFTLGADQLDRPEAKAKLFTAYIATGCVTQIFCLTVLAYLQNRGLWSMAFWISTSGIVMGTFILIAAAPRCKQYRVGGNPVLRVLQVFTAATHKLQVEVSITDSGVLYELPGNKSAIPGSRKLRHTERFSWLDKAAMITDKDFVKGSSSILSTNPWQLCTVTQVEEVKCLLRTIPVWLISSLFTAVIAQGSTLFIEQAQTMDRRLGQITIPSVSLQLFGIFSTILCAVVFEAFLVPVFRRRTGLSKGITSLQRAGCGSFILILTMIVAAITERRRLEIAKLYHTINDPTSPVPFSTFWLLPQIMLMAIAQICMSAGFMDFFYGELSDGMKSFGTSISLLILALGSFISSILVTVVNLITDQSNSGGWIHKNLNEGHVDYFYWLLSAMVSLAFIMYLLVADKYEYLKLENEDE